MTRVSDAADRKIDNARSRWVKPRLIRMTAGNAEQGPTPLADSNGEFS